MLPKNTKRPLLLIILIASLTASAQSSPEKVIIDRQDYKDLLLKCNETADRLHLKIGEVKLLYHRDSLNMAEIEGITYQLNNQLAYVKLLKKQKRRAWFNGLWQGFAVGAGAAVIVVLVE